MSSASGPIGSATLLGYAIDPDDPDATTETIVESLARHRDPVLEAQRLAGRWVLLVESAGRSVVLHDACGLRQVVWTRNAEAGTSCASDPSLLAEVWGYEIDADTAARYLSSPSYTEQLECWWPGTATPYREVRQLLPNHLLDLSAGTIERYWPIEEFETLSPDESAERGCHLLVHLIDAAARRFPLALPLTAGWDSRLLFAAASAAGARCWHYTLSHPGIRGWAEDLAIAGRILGDRGVTQHVVPCPEHMSELFAAVYTDSVTSPHSYWGALAEGLWDGYPHDHVAVKGNVSEIARSYFRWHGDDTVTPADLAVCNAARGNRFASEQLAEWQRDAEPVAARVGIHLLDLYYWEVKMGRWLAQSQLESDLVHETFSPYNYRPLLETLLGTPERARRAPSYELHRKMIERLDHSLLEVPINPRPWISRARSGLDRFARQGARRVGLYKRLRGTNA